MQKFRRTDGQLDRALLWPALIVLSALAVCGGLLLGCGRGETTQTKPEVKAATETVVHERTLPSGSRCSVTLHGALGPKEGFLCLSNLEASINGQSVHVPGESFADLSDIAVQKHVEFAEFTGDTFLLLSGGAGAMAWHAKLAIRSNRVVERELTRASGPPETTPYGPPLQVRYGIIPPAELEKVRANKSR